MTRLAAIWELRRAKIELQGIIDGDKLYYQCAKNALANVIRAITILETDDDDGKEVA